jgi:hypothetical protein
VNSLAGTTIACCGLDLTEVSAATTKRSTHQYTNRYTNPPRTAANNEEQVS